MKDVTERVRNVLTVDTLLAFNAKETEVCFKLKKRISMYVFALHNQQTFLKKYAKTITY